MKKVIIATLILMAAFTSSFAKFGYDQGTSSVVYKDETFDIEGNVGKNGLLRGNCKVYHKESNLLVAVVKYNNNGEEIKTTCHERVRSNFGFSERKTRLNFQACLDRFVNFVNQERKNNKASE